MNRVAPMAAGDRDAARAAVAAARKASRVPRVLREGGGEEGSG
jgi:hypothetical protein